MLDISKLTYRVYVLGPGGGMLNVTDIAENVTWEENDGELAMQVSVDLANAVIGGRRASSIARPGCYLIITAAVNGREREVARCRISEWEPTRSGAEDSVALSGFDELHDLQESQDNRYVPSGTTTGDAIKAVFADWGIPLGVYAGPDVYHAKTTFKNEKLSDIILELLDAAALHGADRCVIRASHGTVSILPKGSNATIYSFEESHNLITTRYKMNVSDIATVVKVVAPEDGDSRQRVEGVVTGHVEFGRHERIYVRDSEDSLSTAMTAAQVILSDEGEPEISFSVEAPDVPFVRKGDRVRVMSRVRSGFFIVKSIHHDASNKRMTMELDASVPAISAATPRPATAKTVSSQSSSSDTATGGYAGTSSGGSVNTNMVS